MNFMERKIEKIIQILQKRYKVKLVREDPFRVLIGVVLSHRTKDDTSWSAADRLFSRAKNLNGFLKLSEKEIAKIIYPVGFYNQKAKRIKKICRIIKEKYHGKVPNEREKLMGLPGVGLKSANIVLSHGFGVPVIATDTHVAVISRRWHLTEHDDPDKITEDLEREIPLKYKMIFNSLLVEFGKEFCTARFPKCRICPVLKSCPYENKNL